MFRVLIVDDEYLLCEHIKRTMDWSELDMEVVATAKDGQQALSIIEELSPDIVLTDIYMPNIDGLELAKTIKNTKPEIAILIITGYSEFKYAQSAVKYGVKHYLLKPVDKTTYTEALKTVREELLNSSHKSELVREAENEMKNKIILRAVKGFAKGEIGFENFCSQVQNTDGSLCAGPKIIFLFQYKLTEDREDITVCRELDETVCDFFFRMLPQPQAPLFACDENRGIAVWPICDGKREETVMLLEKLCVQIELDKNISLFVGVSGAFDNNIDIPERYNQAEQALDSKFVFADCKVITYESVKHDDSYLLSRYLDVGQLLISLRTNNREELIDGENGIAGIFRKLKKDNVSHENMIFTVLMFVSTINEFLVETSMTSIGLSTRGLMKEISSKETVQELQDFASMLIDKALSDVFSDYKPHKFQKTGVAIKYINDHISERNLSLNVVANAIYMNKSYLSDLFKKETGITMGEYISQNRLLFAKKLLDQYPQKSMACIAAEAGFNNEYYFIRCFRNQFGITPGIYVKNKKDME